MDEPTATRPDRRTAVRIPASTSRRAARIPRWSGWGGRTGWGDDTGGRSGWQRGRITASLAGLVGCLLALHDAVPNTVGRLGSLLETFLPWLGLAVAVLLGVAVLRRSFVALLALVLPVVAWLGLFGGVLLPGDDPPYDLTAVTHNVSDENQDPAGTARALLEVEPDLIALAELTPPALPDYAAVLASTYPHHAVRGTVGLWSKLPLADVRPLEIRPAGVGADWNRGLRATARTARGDIAVYVAHLPSLRLGFPDGFGSARRDESAVLLGAEVAAEHLDEVILLGDLNGTFDDRGLDPVTAQLGTAESGFAFSWPATLPVARIDQVLARAATVTRVWALPRTGSDHLPIAARIRLCDC